MSEAFSGSKGNITGELPPSGWLCNECGHFRADNPEDRWYSYNCWDCGARFTTTWVDYHGDYTTSTLSTIVTSPENIEEKVV